MVDADELLSEKQLGCKVFLIGLSFWVMKQVNSHQIGNAVAPYFAYHLALQIKQHILNQDNSMNYPATSQHQLKLFENEAIS